MTGGWAATNTLRDLLWSGPVLGDDNTCFWCGGRYSLGHREDCEAPAALALVEAALDEADLSIHWFSALLSVIEKHDKPLAMGIVAQAGGGQIRLANLAAALRAVREGQ